LRAAFPAAKRRWKAERAQRSFGSSFQPDTRAQLPHFPGGLPWLLALMMLVSFCISIAFAPPVAWMVMPFAGAGMIALGAAGRPRRRLTKLEGSQDDEAQTG
jgi:hypothetical protein